MTRRPRAGDAVNMATKAIGVHPKSKLSAGDTALGGDTYVSRTPDQPALYLSGVLGLFMYLENSHKQKQKSKSENNT